MSTAISRRLRVLELKAGKTGRPTTAFVIRAANPAQAKAMLDRAIASQQVHPGDPMLVLTCIGFEDGQWEDVAHLSLDDLAALAEGGSASRDAALLSDNELHAAIIDGLPRVA